MWLIIVACLLIAAILISYLYWLLFLKRLFPVALRCFLIHDVIAKTSFISASEISVRQFRMLLEEAERLGYRFVSSSEFFADDDPKSLLLTFDDGFDSLYEHVFPILVAREIPSLVFVVGGFAGERPSWDYHLSNRRHLTSSQIEEMTASGLVSFGSHSATHPDLTKVDKDRLDSELMRSKECRHFSYPFGKLDKRVIEFVRDAGYDKAFCTLNGKPSLWDYRLAIPRIPLNRFDNRFTLRTKIRGGAFYWCEVVKARIIGLFAPLTYEWRGRP